MKRKNGLNAALFSLITFLEEIKDSPLLVNETISL